MPINLASFDLTQLPAAEDDEVEFKSSLIGPHELKKEIGFAASAFGNSGGGLFVAGVDRNGSADGGFLTTIGKQPIRDWVDQVIHQVEPAPIYDVKLITDPSGRGFVDPGSAMVLVAIDASAHGPHMAPDKRYYIRAGAHTVAARNFIVEALWARRHHSKPRIAHIASVEAFSSHSSTLFVELVAITDAPALDVRIDFEPRPDHLRWPFPLPASLVDKAHSYVVSFEVPNKPPFHSTLSVAYRDLAGNDYTYTAKLEAEKCRSRQDPRAYPLERIANAIQHVAQQLKAW
jgi:hypothetical protein